MIISWVCRVLTFTQPAAQQIGTHLHIQISGYLRRQVSRA
jgi:hypothetical protein